MQARKAMIRCVVVSLSFLNALSIVGRSEDKPSDTDRHWSFRTLRRPAVPTVRDASRVRTPIDRFVQAKLEERGLSLGPAADKPTLIRRVAFDVTGLPPTPAEVAEFVADDSPDTYERMVERYLASPHYGERWGKFWLEAAGYADSNGYFNADSDRPLAYRYRDYVIRSFNADKPFDQMVREQIAGDELCGFDPQQHERHATPPMIEMLEATHFLRNGPDGSGESDGNPDEVKADRYYALEAAQQILVSSLLGLTIQCAKCHDHKFEPITQREYYQLQAHLYPVFHLEKWVKPNERQVQANLPGELEAWELRQRDVERQIAALRSEFSRWVRDQRPSAGMLFRDDFDDANRTLADDWSNTAPGDDTPGGTAAVKLIDQAEPAQTELPAAVKRAGALQIAEGGPGGDKWLSTKRTFDWTPNQPGEWIQATFDVVADKVRPDEPPAARIAFFIATRDFNDNETPPADGGVRHGNILFDGNPAGGAAVFVDYPGDDQQQRGVVGTSGFQPGHNYGVRITNVDGRKFRVEQLVDWLTEEKSLELTTDDLPDGGFGFEFCCGRNFVVDNVEIESSQGSANDDSARIALKHFRDEHDTRRKQLSDRIQKLEGERSSRPPKISWASDVAPEPPDVPLLVRGNPTTPGELVQPATLHALTDEAPRTSPRAARTTGRRTELANWLTSRNSRAFALMARVQANRIWQHHIGRGIVTTTDNLGVSGSEPSHPELLDWLAAEFVSSHDSENHDNDSESRRWSCKRLHRWILNSAVYRQSSALNAQAFAVDPNNRLWWRNSIRRLDAEAIRDGMLSVSGELNRAMFGSYTPTQRSSAAEVVVNESLPGARKRSVYLQQRRTQTLSLLGLFDAPSLTFNCVHRPVTTMPLQALSLLNSDFALARAHALALRLEREAARDPRLRVRLAFELTRGSEPSDDERRAALQFIEDQTRLYEPATDATQHAWTDFCHMLLSANASLYVE